MAAQKSPLSRCKAAGPKVLQTMQYKMQSKIKKFFIIPVDY